MTFINYFQRLGAIFVFAVKRKLVLAFAFSYLVNPIPLSNLVQLARKMLIDVGNI